MEDVKVAQKLTSLESSLASPDDNLPNFESLTKLISNGKIKLSSDPSNHFFPSETMHDASTLLPKQASLEEKSRDDQVKNSKYGSDYSPKTVEQSDLNRGHIDTTAPSEFVKEAVSKFGGIVDWKAHRIQIVERQKLMDQELEKARKEIPEYKRWSEAAEEAKTKVLKELDSTKRLIEELKLNLQRAQTEENQAKQDSELAMLRLVELEQGIADDASIAAKAQLEVAKARHTAAVSELKSVKAEMETLRKEYDFLVKEKDVAVANVEVAMAASKEAELTVEELTIELIAAKELLESSHFFQLEAEEKRIVAALARELDYLNWEELKEANEEAQRLNRKVISVKDLTSKLNSASTLLLDLRNELDSYMELKLKENLKEGPEKMDMKTHEEMQAAIALAKKELGEEKVNIKKAISGVNCLKVAAISLRSELGTEKSTLFAVRQTKGMASIAVSALESEIENTILELALIQMKEKEAREKIYELPKQLQLLAMEAEQTKMLVQTAREEMQKAKEEAEQPKAEARTIKSQLIAVQKEIEASKASKRLAVAAIKALKESESTRTTIEMDSPSRVTLSLEDYHELSKRAREVEEQAYIRVSASLSQIEIAKESESKSLAKLEEVNKEITARKEAQKIAKDKAEEGKLGVEQELRKWWAEHEQMRKANESDRNAIKSPTKKLAKKDSTKLDQAYQAYLPASHVVSPKLQLCAIITSMTSLSEPKMGKRNMKSFIPRILSVFGRKKAALVHKSAIRHTTSMLSCQSLDLNSIHTIKIKIKEWAPWGSLSSAGYAEGADFHGRSDHKGSLR